MMSPAAMRGPRIEKTVKPYDADWNVLLSFSLSAASPTCRQDDGDIHCRRRQPGKVILDEASILVPMRHVRDQKRWPARETVDFIQTAEAELFIFESFIDFVVYVLNVELLNQGHSCASRHLFWKQTLLSCDFKVALVCNQRGVGEEEAESTCPQLFVALLHTLGVAFGACVATTTLGFRVMFWGSAFSPQQLQGSVEARYKVQKRGSNRKRGIGLRNIRFVVQIKCISICSVRQISRDRSN